MSKVKITFEDEPGFGVRVKLTSNPPMQMHGELSQAQKLALACISHMQQDQEETGVEADIKGAASV